MFLPNSNAASTKAAIKENCFRVEVMALSLLPDDIREHATISVQEVTCGDPECSPVDTVITITFPSGGSGVVALPFESREVNIDELRDNFPTVDYLRKWYNGEEAEWPPDLDDDDDDSGVPMAGRMPNLRFEVGTAVQCRVGPEEWFPGIVTQKWYRENTWPQGAWAPYKIRLSDGRDIFAPADLPQIIKAADEAQSTE